MTDVAAKIAAARSLLTAADRKPSAMSALGAAGLAATAAVLMAGVVILGPGADLAASVSVAEP